MTELSNEGKLEVVDHITGCLSIEQRESLYHHNSKTEEINNLYKGLVDTQFWHFAHEQSDHDDFDNLSWENEYQSDTGSNVNKVQSKLDDETGDIIEAVRPILEYYLKVIRGDCSYADKDIEDALGEYTISLEEWAFEIR